LKSPPAEILDGIVNMHLFSRKIQAPNAKRKYLAHDSLPHKKIGMDSLDPAYVSKKGCLFQDTTVATCSLGFLTGGAVNLAAEGGGTLVGSFSRMPGCPVESEGLCREGGKMYYIILVTRTERITLPLSDTFLEGGFPGPG